MESERKTLPMNPAKEAEELAKLFNDLSVAIDQYRLSDQDPPLSSAELSRLKDEAQAMEDRAHYFTAEAIGATLVAIEPSLENIKAITSQAKAQLAVLNKTEKVISIATSALSLGTAIAAGNPQSIFASAEALACTLTT